jgi:hypothetical protein
MVSSTCVGAQKLIERIIQYYVAGGDGEDKQAPEPRQVRKQDASPSATDYPSRHRITVQDLKNCMAQKSAAQLAAQLPNSSRTHMLVQKVPCFPPLCNIVHREEETQVEIVNEKE